MLATMETPLYLMKIRPHNLFAVYVQVSFIWSWFNVPQAARELQTRLNTQRNLSENLQCKFDDISNTPQDGDDDSTSPSKRQRRMREDPDDQPSVEEAEADEVKRLGRRFVILHGPWLRRKELIFQIELEEDYDEEERFKDTNTMLQGQLYEIRGLLPEKYLGDAFTKKWLSKSVSNVCFLYECTNCSISSLREWTHNVPTLLRASGNLLPPYSVLTHWIWVRRRPGKRNSVIWSAGLRISMAEDLIQHWRLRSFTGTTAVCTTDRRYFWV